MSKFALSGIKDSIEKVLRAQLASIGLDHIELKEGFDHDGDAAVFVTAVLPLNAPLVPGGVSSAASLAVANIVDASGDARLSYLSIRYPDDVRPID